MFWLNDENQKREFLYRYFSNNEGFVLKGDDFISENITVSFDKEKYGMYWADVKSTSTGEIFASLMIPGNYQDFEKLLDLYIYNETLV
jgi:hypothetical protein